MKLFPLSSATPAATGVPDVQAGKWKLRLTRNGRTNENEMCGDPIDGFRGEVQTYAANAKQAWGCTLTTNPSGRNVTVVYDCPNDRSPDGRPVQKGRWELSMVSASPQQFRIEMKTTTADAAYVMVGTRIGECNK